MTTSIINIEDNIDEIVRHLSDGNVLAFPTETVYGLGGDIFNISAIDEIYRLKKRMRDKPLAAHICDISQVELLSDNIPDVFYKLAERFLPGPLSLIIPKSNSISDKVTSGINTIGIRFPDNPVFLKMCKAFGKPLAGTSANESGGIDAISSQQVLNEFDGKIKYIIDSGELNYKKASTVLNLVGEIKILREGAIKKHEIEEFIKKTL